MAGTFKKMKTYVTGEEEEKGLVDEVKHELDCCKSLSWATRLKGFIICMIVGASMTILAVVMVFLKKYPMFGVFYSLGTITALASSLFLRGPIKQLKSMFEEKRFIATLIMLLMLALTLCAALWWKNGALTLVFAIGQFIALLWYGLSYIPYARALIKNCAQSCIA